MKTVIPILLCFALGGLIGWVLAGPTLETPSTASVTSLNKPAIQESSPNNGDDRSGTGIDVVLDEDASEFERLTAVALMEDQPFRGDFAEQLELLTEIEHAEIRSPAVAALLRQCSSQHRKLHSPT